MLDAQIKALAMLSPIAVAAAIGFLRWAYHSIKPPPPKIRGSPGGLPVTSPRIKLGDGRHLSYREMGVPKDEADYKIIIIHGFDSSKDLKLPVSQDRAGYGESDPNPSKTVKSEAFDIQELADQLQLGSRFYIMGISLGGYPTYGCLKYIPHRLSGASLVVPSVHYWWPDLPTFVSSEALKKLPVPDRWTFRVACYAPWLLYWWMTQKWFTSLSIMAGNMDILSRSDREIFDLWKKNPDPDMYKVRQQGFHESLVRDLIAAYAKWEFSPLDLENLFPEGQGSVHLWHASEDRIIPREINHYISEKLPWIRYHEFPDKGHFLIFENDPCETILKELFV